MENDTDNTMITINSREMSVADWEKELETVLDPGWFDTIVRHIEESGSIVENLLAKRKACYVRCARYGGVYKLWVKWYERDFDEAFPVYLSGKDWRKFVKEGDDAD